MEDDYRIRSPLLEPAAVPPELAFPNTTSGSSIVLRISLLFLIGAVSVLANYEASKGFAVTVINESGDDTIAGRRFDVFYVRNDGATRAIVRASKLMEADPMYYPDRDRQVPKIGAVILKLVNRTLTQNVVAVEKGRDREFVVKVCPSVMEAENFQAAFFSAVLRGITEILHWDTAKKQSAGGS